MGRLFIPRMRSNLARGLQNPQPTRGPHSIPVPCTERATTSPSEGAWGDYRTASLVQVRLIVSRFIVSRIYPAYKIASKCCRIIFASNLACMQHAWQSTYVHFVALRRYYIYAGEERSVYRIDMSKVQNCLYERM